jgi:hypothetical protein
MKRILIPIACLFFAACISCNNSTDKKADDNSEKKEVPKTHADSLMADIMDGHDVGMAKMSKMTVMQNEVQGVLDSISKLPAKSKKALEPYTSKMEGLLQDLKSARSGMEKWMDEFNMDSALNNMEQRVEYLTEEKLKISSVKETMLNSLHKADSLLKAKF